MPPMTSHDWRRGFAFIGVWGGCVCSFGYICVLTWMLREDAEALFKLAMAANVHLLFGMIALGWFGGRRLHLAASREGVTLNDHEHQAPPRPLPDLPHPTFGQGEHR